ncbi:MAG: hypothetical protein WC683_02860 [bacterium]
MACYCGVCARRLSDATENYGSFQTSPNFEGWDIPETRKWPVINDTCEGCAKILRDAVTKAANEIVLKNLERVESLARTVAEDREKQKRAEREKAEFERAWRQHKENPR